MVALLLAPAAQAGIVAAGWGGTVLASNDGATWNQPSTGTGASFFATAPGWPSVSVGTAGITIVSNDGSSWQPSSSGTPQWLNGVARSGNTWIAVGTAGTILRRDGSGPWQESVSPTISDLTAIATDGARWLAVGAGGTVATSLDGVSWTASSAGGSSLMAAASGDGTWLVAGAGGTMLRSSDLASWTPVTSGTFAAIRGLAHDGDDWFAVGNAGMILHSSDATSWSAISSGTSANLAAVAAGCQGAWAAVGDAGVIVSSDDGGAWSPVASGTTENLRGVACTPAAPAPLACPTLATSPSVPVTLQAAGGTPTYFWVSPGAPDNATGPSYSVSFDAPGTYDVTLSDSGGLPYGIQTALCEVDVASPGSDSDGDGAGNGDESAGSAGGESSSTPGQQPPPSCLPAAQSVAIGAAAALEADGTAPFSWEAPAAASETSGLTGGFTVTYSALGTYTVTVTGGGGQSASCTVNVVDVLHASAGGPYEARLVPEGAFVTLAASVSGGTAPYACSWTGTGLLDNRHACSTGARFSSVGDAALVVTVNDAAGSAATASTVVHVVAAPASTTGPEARPPVSAQIVRGQGIRPDGSTLCAGDDEECRLDSPLAAAPAPAHPASSSIWPETPPETGLTVAVIVGSLAGLVAVRYFLLRQGILVTAVVLFSRLRRSDLMENPTRAFLVERIASEPGVHFRELVRASGKGRGTVQYHLNVLVRAGTVAPVHLRGFTGYRMADTPWTERLPARRALRAPKAREFIEILQADGCLRVAELAERGGVTYAGALYHLQRLSQAGLVEVIDLPGKERKARVVEGADLTVLPNATGAAA